MSIFDMLLSKLRFLSLFAAMCLILDCSAARNNRAPAKRTPRAETEEQSDKQGSAKQEILMDFDTGEVLHSKDAEDRCVPSSMTKVMTAYMVFLALRDKRLHLDDEIPVSENAQKKEGSRSFFKAGTLAKVEDLVRSVIVHSGNDACTVLAEKLSGDEDAFAKEMNEKGVELGLKNTNFVNSTGLPHDEHYSCLHDIATIARHIIQDFPEYYHYFSEKTFTVNDITQQNRNTLLGNSLSVDGLKTGRTNSGGYGIVISAKKNGKRLIAVVNGCKTIKSRAQEGNKILAIGFNDFIVVKISEKEKPVGIATVIYGKRDTVNLYTKDAIVISIPKKYKNSLVVELDVKEPIEAPISAGAVLGKIRYKYGNYVSQDYDLFTPEPVASMNFFEKCIAYGKELFTKGSMNFKSKKDVEAPIGISTK